MRENQEGDVINTARERNLGVQPIERLMAQYKVTPHDLVLKSTQQLTHKMVARAVKGRRLTPRVKLKILTALNAAAGESFGMSELFTY